MPSQHSDTDSTTSTATPHESVTAAVEIVSENGSGYETDFAKLKDELTDDGHRHIHVWRDTPTGDPDITYRHASITSIIPDEP